jgi:glutaredoxin
LGWYNQTAAIKEASSVLYLDPINGWKVLGASSASVADSGSSATSALPSSASLAGGSYVVYTQRGCGHCDSAIGCLRRNRCSFRTVEATAALAKKYGIVTTPHIMFKDEASGKEHFVGGYTELEKLMRTMHFMNTTVMWKRVSQFHQVYNEHRHSPWTFCGSKICCRNTKSNMAQIDFLLRRNMISKSDLNVMGSYSANTTDAGTIEIDATSLLRSMEEGNME